MNSLQFNAAVPRSVENRPHQHRHPRCMTLLGASVVVAAIVGSTTSASAQGPGVYSPFIGPPVFANPGLHGYTHSSTAPESFRRGAADIHRSLGERRLLEAEAARRYQDARSYYYDNAVKYLSVKEQRRRIGEARRAARYRKLQRRRELQMYLNRGGRGDVLPVYVQAAIPPAAVAAPSAPVDLQLVN